MNTWLVIISVATFTACLNKAVVRAIAERMEPHRPYSGRWCAHLLGDLFLWAMIGASLGSATRAIA